MLGINTLETDEITFGDGTTMSSTSDFASASDLGTVSAQATTNTASIAAKQDAITAGNGLAFNGSTLNAEVQSSDLTSKQDAITAGNGLAFNGSTLNAEVQSSDLTSKQDTLTAGDGIDITGTTIKAEYLLPQMKLISYNKDNVVNPSNLQNRWGNGSNSFTQTTNRTIGTPFCSTTGATITFTQNGYYRIRAHSNAQSDGYNDRVSFMIYLRVNNTDYDQSMGKNFFSWTYIRNNSDAAHGNNSFEDYIYLTSGTRIEVRHKLETGNNRNFDNTLTNTQLDVYLNLQIERIHETNPEE